ncbi:glucosamine-6-phosphate deaminase 1 [Halobacillus andaensis]|uniref:Glucosamine-6-phosphate deaminase n=1 Tax=Halobacillus andaensis TaxID=1176239 RepID=A0A917B8U1_HALAA|nr:glucosamine-6-phosphate deaminase [Halobacillus andaensis]MBP2005167.1 glucosamine-6-phosphate deaminase [Halobacillus andaensis]GGF29361.1 glucosamine-6-phosphate deaminase 1 [Halobacillus andaensis]
MKVIITHNNQELSEKACELIEQQVKEKPDSVLGLATGGSPLGTYNEMIKGCNHRSVDYEHVKALNLDEYIGLDKNDPQSYHFFMRKHLFDHININPDHTYIPNGKAKDLQEECEQYEQFIEDIGPPDLQLLGIGQNGHIGFNEPGTPFDRETHIIQLEESTRQANARFFESIDDVPKQAITMGIQSILKSKKIVVIASGERKADAIQRLLEEEPSENLPASALRNHKNVTLIVDEEAYQKVGQGEETQ